LIVGPGEKGEPYTGDASRGNAGNPEGAQIGWTTLEESATESCEDPRKGGRTLGKRKERGESETHTIKRREYKGPAQTEKRILGVGSSGLRKHSIKKRRGQILGKDHLSKARTKKVEMENGLRKT